MTPASLSLYTGSGFNAWEIGDISVIQHNGVFHLFHLIIPNHDYIAHAISKDGISWRRVDNALFVGNPGEWDDDMLWTMHIYDAGDRFEMYYTGLQRKDRGVQSKIGLAVSKDLYQWEKVSDGIFPFGSEGPHYESLLRNDRTWLSFRDPFRYDHNGETYFLICGRAAEGPHHRRGCVALVKKEQDGIQYLPPLHYPRIYDDVECPCLFELNGKYYLIGSIREDIKVRYWFADEPFGEYHCFHSNVILPQGAYAARVLKDNDGATLLFSFYFTYGKIDSLRVILPPTQLKVDDKHRLVVVSANLWEKMIRKTLVQQDFTIKHLYNNATAFLKTDKDQWLMGSRSGYEFFVMKKESEHFIWEGILQVEGLGKLGLVTDMDENGSGYYYSFDVMSGHVQSRAWGFNEHDPRNNFSYQAIQDNVFTVSPTGTYHFKLIRFGNYVELSMNGIVKLCFIDYKFNGDLFGFYTSSSSVSLTEMKFSILPAPKNEYMSEQD